VVNLFPFRGLSSAAAPAQAAYRKWGWRKVAQKRNPLPGSPLFDVFVKELTHPDAR
jgi:hypothetical protein